jgi:hypothetical protein
MDDQMVTDMFGTVNMSTCAPGFVLGCGNAIEDANRRATRQKVSVCGKRKRNCAEDRQPFISQGDETGKLERIRFESEGVSV